MDRNKRARELAEAHWDYIKTLLQVHNHPEREIKTIEFHYKAAFVHGYKHALEDTIEERRDT